MAESAPSRIFSNLLAANAIVFVGSTGADLFTGYAQSDTMTGGGGNDA